MKVATGDGGNVTRANNHAMHAPASASGSLSRTCYVAISACIHGDVAITVNGTVHTRERGLIIIIPSCQALALRPTEGVVRSGRSRPVTSRFNRQNDDLPGYARLSA